MNDKESDGAAFEESDHAETVMTFDTGGVPFVVAFIWICTLVSGTIFMLTYALPDLTAWFGG